MFRDKLNRIRDLQRFFNFSKIQLLWEIWNCIGRVTILLSCLGVLTSFVEANMWHFTEPDTLGFTIWPVVVFLISIIVPQITMLFRTVRAVRPFTVIEFSLIILPALLLLVVSLPVLGKQPAVRTILLSVGVFSIPFLFYWVLLRQSFSPNKCCTKLSCFSNRPNNCSTNQDTLLIENDNYFLATEILMAILFSMSCRWVSVTINLFYEAYEPPLIIFILIVVYISSHALKNCMNYTKNGGPEDISNIINEAFGMKELKENPTPQKIKPECSANSDTANNALGLETPLENTGKINENNCIESIIRVNKSETLPASIEEETSLLTPIKVVVIWLTGILTGLEMGSVALTFLWNLSSPNILCLWSGVDPKLYGSTLLVVFLSSIIISIIGPRAFIKKVGVKWISEFVSLILLFISVLAFVIIVFCTEENKGILFTLSCSLVFFLPLVFLIMSYNFKLIVKIALLRVKGCNYVSFLPGAIGLVAALTFFSIHVLSIFFVTPFTTRAILGNIKLMTGSQLAIISLALILHFIFNCLEFLPPLKNRPSPLSKASLAKQNRKKTIAIVISTLFVLICIAIGPTFLIRQGMYRHEKAIHSIKVKSLGRHDTLRVLSWNILLNHDYWGRDSSSCVGEVIQAVQANVVGLQESDPLPLYWGGKDSLSYFKTFLNDKYVALSGVSPLNASYGVAVLTELSVVDHSSFFLPTDTNFDVPNYQAVEASLDISSKLHHLPENSSKKLHVFNIHFVYKGWADPPLTNLSRTQIKFVIDKIKLIPKDIPLIVMGDFNVTPDKPELDPFYDKALGLKSALHSDRNKTMPSTLIGDSFEIVDYIFYRGLELVSSQTILEVDLVSDHRPVFAEFCLP